MNGLSGIAICLSLSIYVASSSCSWTVNGQTLNLNALKGTTITATSGSFEYDYTVCTDATTCGSNTAQSQQRNPSNGNCAYLSKWDSSVKPTSSGSGNNTVWSFYYANGQLSGGCSDTGRVFVPTWTCGTTATPSASAYESSTCVYEMDITTSHACPSSGGGGGGSSSGGLSGGSVFLIILFVCLFLYCCVGYIVNQQRSPENGWGNYQSNTPQYNFWVLLPKWTWAGCLVTKDWIMGKVSGGSAGDGYEEPISDETGGTA